MTKRIYTRCGKCQRSWLIEGFTPKWCGTAHELMMLEKERGRKWNRCYCGEFLY